MVNQLDECTPDELVQEIQGLDCTQERAHEIKRYADKCWEHAIDRDDFSDEEWGLLIGKVNNLWGDYVHFHTNDRF